VSYLKYLFLLIFISCSVTSSGVLMNENGYEKAYFAGGCFWCMEPPFEAMEGVIEATSGYMGGTTENPTYEEVTTGETGHAEVVEILFDPKTVTYEELLEVFWRNIDPTALNYQFADVGSQYRTEIFTVGSEQKDLAEQSKVELENSGKFNKPIVTAISEAPAFYIAEEYHQDFYKKQSMRYQMYAKASGRKGFLEDTWGED
jgi:methionine-S-sulfoxide reductase